MATHRPLVRIHAELMVVACPLHCVIAAADEQGSKGPAPEVLWSRTDQCGEALLLHRGDVTAPQVGHVERLLLQVAFPLTPCQVMRSPDESCHPDSGHWTPDTRHWP